MERNTELRGPSKPEDRARSYSGVVSHGDGNRDGGQADGFRVPKYHQGKGKGRMHDDYGPKRSKGGDRGNNRSQNHRNNNGIEDARSGRYQGEHSRSFDYERHRSHSQVRRTHGDGEDKALNNDAQQEEGEIESSKDSQHEMEKPQSPLTGSSQPVPIQVEPAHREEDLDGEKDLLAGEVPNFSAHGMELEGNLFVVEGEETLQGSEDDFQDLTDDEGKEILKESDQEAGNVGNTVMEGEVPMNMEKAEERDLKAGDVVKKDGARRPVFNTGPGGVASKKFAQVILSPRKHTLVKQGIKGRISCSSGWQVILMLVLFWRHRWLSQNFENGLKVKFWLRYWPLQFDGNLESTIVVSWYFRIGFMEFGDVVVTWGYVMLLQPSVRNNIHPLFLDYFCYLGIRSICFQVLFSPVCDQLRVPLQPVNYQERGYNSLWDPLLWIGLRPLCKAPTCTLPSINGFHLCLVILTKGWHILWCQCFVQVLWWSFIMQYQQTQSLGLLLQRGRINGSFGGKNIGLMIFIGLLLKNGKGDMRRWKGKIWKYMCIRERISFLYSHWHIRSFFVVLEEVENSGGSCTSY
ncbi:unnamed protein product [Eruca vesicaria subsp. sativa]|uniref:Uncharacterized protein n=1 Tax=Eruca vesicaria subsp. sativa TaxID=29727 RepID=A0ABC8KU93_ERUVS|nr:unnamed protein product [Eruca vesicaria subsp. sativa]